MEEVRARRTDPWMWIAIVAVAALLVLLVVWLVAARSPDPGTEPGITATEEDRTRDPAQQPTEDADRVIIRDREHVREVVRERPVYVYAERPDPVDETETPREVIVVPRDARDPGAQYERVDLPARFELDGREWIIRPGRPVRGAPNDFTSTGMQVEGRIVYVRTGTIDPPDSLYLRIRPDSGIYVPYEAYRS